MIAVEPNKLPNPAPRYLRLLLGLPSDATAQEIQNEWDQQVIPLFSVGPKVLFDELVMNTMGGGLPAEKAYRVVAQSKRGQQLKSSMEREAAYRQRSSTALPPFAKSSVSNELSTAQIPNAAVAIERYSKAEGVSKTVAEAFGNRLANDALGALDGWVQIAPYGQFPHARGVQHVDQATARKMTARFQHGVAGLPWYRGHPDVDPVRHTDSEAYGWIHDLEPRSDGLYGNVEWTPKGEQLIRHKSYKYFSPVWDAESARANGKPVLKPTQIVSVGFTNTPNIPVKPIN